MDSTQPPLLPPAPARRRNTVALKLLFIATLVLLLQLPLSLINELRHQRTNLHVAAPPVMAEDGSWSVADGYRMVERSLKYSALVLTLVFAAFFMFETLADLRLHAIHYGLVGAAMCLFYLTLLALGEILSPGLAYIGAAVSSSLLITLYCASILRSLGRAGAMAGLLTVEYGVLFVVLRMENYALLAGTATLFVVLSAVMYFTRNVDWFNQDSGREARA